MLMVVRGKEHLFDTKTNGAVLQRRGGETEKGRVEVTKGVWDGLER